MTDADPSILSFRIIFFFRKTFFEFNLSLNYHKIQHYHYIKFNENVHLKTTENYFTARRVLQFFLLYLRIVTLYIQCR